MSSDPADGNSPLDCYAPDSVEYLLFDSLVHHLIEKGVLSKNDALSIVQTAAHVVRGRVDGGLPDRSAEAALAALERTYTSFEAIPHRYVRPGLGAPNVLPLRTPLHGEHPHFPSEDD